MNIAYARKLLSVTEKDDLQSLKKKYRRLMSECHPDALGSDNPAHIRRAQEINEAYQLLKKEPHAFRTKMSGREDRRYGREGKKSEREEKKRPEWTGQVNERAFRDRKIYQYYSMETVSIHQLVKDLLEEKEAGMQIKSRLFHILAEQFTEPVSILHKIAGQGKKDKENREIYHFPAYLKVEKRKHPPEGMTLYPKAFQSNRIMVCSKEGAEYGHLSFEDDRLYFCLIPLLKEKLAKVKMTVHNGKVDFCIRLEKEAETYRIPNRNLEIAELLGRL